MELKKVTAIFRSERLEEVEGRLNALGVGGITVTKVKGYGEYANFFSQDWLVSHVRIEIFHDASRAQEIAEAIMESAHTGTEGNGIAVILPVDKTDRIRTKSEAQREEI